MVSKGINKYVVWPIYFEKSVSRKQGRKVPRNYAVEKPSLEDIYKISKKMGLKPVKEEEASYPSRPRSKKGRVLIDKKDSKSNLLKKISKQLQ
ncbi:MAG: signal recognition particle subunit SRP19/SEC65 family protein [Candidatus Thermoplasmatota archaeon]